MSNCKMYETIETSRSGRVLSIRLNRPKALNALNDQMLHDILDAARRADSDPEIGALLLCGDARAFAAGADITELARHDRASMQAQNVFAGWDDFARLSVPKVVAVAGYALGGGCELAMMCDVIIAGENARFGQPEVKIGCIPGMGGTQRLTRLVGRAVAMDMILTGRMIEAPEALRAGLVSRVVSDAQLPLEAEGVAKTIAEYPRDIIRLARACVLEAEETTLSSGLRHERGVYHSLYGSAAQREGMAAFLEKRAPRFNDHALG